MRPWLVTLPILAAGVGASAQSLPSNPTEALSTLAGPYYAGADDQVDARGKSSIGFYGTDLGMSFVHEGQLRFLFGDTWSRGDGTAINSPALFVNPADDAQGFICMDAASCPDGSADALFPDAAAVRGYLEAQPRTEPWRRSGPPIHFRTNTSGNVASIALYRGGAGDPLLMGLGRTPTAAFSNAKTGPASAAVGLFTRAVSVQCSTSEPCATGLTCDLSIGRVRGSSGDDVD